LQWLVGNMTFQPEAPSNTGEGAAKTAAEDPTANPEGDVGAHHLVDTQLETAESGNKNDNTKV
jgi:hypothetical protein